MGSTDRFLTTNRVARKRAQSNVRKVVLLQALHRRRLAKKELVTLKTEAKSATKFKEISYKLENKVVELTQTLQKRTAERKEFQERVSTLESQIQQWSLKQTDADARIKELTAELKKPTVPAAQFEELLAAKQQVDHRIEEALAHIAEQDAEIDRLNAEVAVQHKVSQGRQLALEAAASKTLENSSAATGMQDEINALKEQINRANALSALTRNTRVPQPPSPTVTHLNGSNGAYRGMDPLPNLPSTGRTPRRHSMTGVLHDGDGHRTSADERLLGSKRDASQARAISMAFPRDGPPNGRDSQGLPVSFENPDEEIMRMLEDEAALERDVLQGLIMDLKILAPSLNNPPKFNEVMFPANLVSLIVNEMWKYGLIKESERFLANVMQHIQKFVMVRPRSRSTRCFHSLQLTLVLAIIAEFRRRGYHHSRFLLVVEHPSAALLRLLGPERHAGRCRPWCRRSRPLVRMVRL